MKKPTKNPIEELTIGSKIEVVWLDAMTKVFTEVELSGDLTKYKAGCINVDIGRFLGVNNDCLVIGLERCQGTKEVGASYRGTTDIPIGMIRGIYKLGRIRTIWERPKQNGSPDKTRAKGSTGSHSNSTLRHSTGSSSESSQKSVPTRQ